MNHQIIRDYLTSSEGKAILFEIITEDYFVNQLRPKLINSRTENLIVDGVAGMSEIAKRFTGAMQQKLIDHIRLNYAAGAWFAAKDVRYPVAKQLGYDDVDTVHVSHILLSMMNLGLVERKMGGSNLMRYRLVVKPTLS
jgi:hypothetical protein